MNGDDEPEDDRRLQLNPSRLDVGALTHSTENSAEAVITEDRTALPVRENTANTENDFIEESVAGSTANQPSSSPSLDSNLALPSASSRQCWICYMMEDDDTSSIWLQPCKCIGGTKWVHLRCLQSWINEKLKENKNKKVACPQCKTDYLIIFPKVNLVVQLLDVIDRLIYRVCPFVTAGVALGIFYWNAVTYGTIVVSHVLGEDEYYVMDDVDPSVMIVALPFIPISLVILELFRWEDSFLSFLRRISRMLPCFSYVLPTYVIDDNGEVVNPPVDSEINLSRILAGALLLPVIAKFCGMLFFPAVPSVVNRTLLGGASFVLMKGLIRMYHKQQVYKRLSRRRILDYTDENIRLLSASRPFIQASFVATPWPGQMAQNEADQLE